MIRVAVPAVTIQLPFPGLAPQIFMRMCISLYTKTRALVAWRCVGFFFPPYRPWNNVSFSSAE